MRFLTLLLGMCLVLAAGCDKASGGGGGDGAGQATGHDPLFAKLIDGEYTAVVSAAGQDQTGRFAASVAQYLLGNAKGLAAAREAALPDDAARTRAAAWIRANVGDTEGATAEFLRGLAAELDYDVKAALNHYGVAADAAPESSRFGYCRAAADPDAKYAASIPDDRKFTYKGTLKLDRSVWVPDPSDFEIVGGAVVTSLGPYAAEATFTDWTMFQSETAGVEVGWTPLLTEGTLILPPAVKFTDPGPDVILRVQATYEEAPLDYFGRYRLVSLRGNEDRYPMLWVPYILRGRQWSSRGFLGEELRLSPEDVNDFVQVAFFPIETPWNISPKVDSPEKGLDFTYDLGEYPGEFKFKEMALMYRLPGEPPDDTIAVKNENTRLYWMENTSLGRKKVVEGTVWGPLRTLPVIRSGPLPTVGKTVPSETTKP